MPNLLARIWSDDEGQDLIEYALLLAMILLLSVSALQGIGSQASDIYEAVGKALGQKKGKGS